MTKTPYREEEFDLYGTLLINWVLHKNQPRNQKALGSGSTSISWDYPIQLWLYGYNYKNLMKNLHSVLSFLACIYKKISVIISFNVLFQYLN